MLLRIWQNMLLTRWSLSNAASYAVWSAIISSWFSCFRRQVVALRHDMRRRRRWGDARSPPPRCAGDTGRTVDSEVMTIRSTVLTRRLKDRSSRHRPPCSLCLRTRSFYAIDVVVVLTSLPRGPAAAAAVVVVVRVAVVTPVMEMMRLTTGVQQDIITASHPATNIPAGQNVISTTSAVG